MQQGKRHSADQQPRPVSPWIYAVATSVFVLLAVGGWLIFSPGDKRDVTVGQRGAETITVGAMYPREFNKEESDDILRGEKFAVEYINVRDDLALPPPALPGGAGLLDATLKLVPKALGNRCDAAGAFDRLVDDNNAVAVLGAYESTITLQAIVAADSRGVPLVSESASAPSLTERPRKPGNQLKGCDSKLSADPRPSDWFFRIGPSDRETAKQFLSLFAAKHTRTDQKPRVAILHESNDIFGNTTASVTKTLAEEKGMTVRQFKYHTVLGPNGKPPCNKLQKLVGEIATYKPDVLFAASYPPDAIVAFQTMKDRNYTPPALLTFGAGFLSESFVSGAGKPSPLCIPQLPVADAAGIVSRASWSRKIALGNGATRPIVKAYEKRFDKPMNSRSAAGFTAMLTVAQAIRDAGTPPDPNKIRDALQRLDLPAAATIMPWDGVDFDTTGENTKARVVLQQIIDGGYVDVDADEVKWPLARARK